MTEKQHDARKERRGTTVQGGREKGEMESKGTHTPCRFLEDSRTIFVGKTLIPTRKKECVESVERTTLQ